MLDQTELKRYNRHLLMSNFGLEAQLKLKAARVLVIGAGGLGGPVLYYLAAAGVGTIGIVENDLVDISNLQRQILFDEATVGTSKLQAAIKRLTALNSGIEFIPHETRLTTENALDLIAAYDFVVDTSDNFPTRYLVNDACEILQIPFVYAAIHLFEGQVAIFNVNGVSYRDLFPSPPAPELAPNCSEAGVLGVLPGIIGSMQANEAIKLITGVGQPLAGKLFVFDALSLTSRTIKILADPERKKITKLIDYEDFCGLKKQTDDISFDAYLRWNPSSYQLLDVRTIQEYGLENLNGLNIPLDELNKRLTELDMSTRIVVHCKTGIRSRKAVELLKKAGFIDVFNLMDPQF